MANYLAVTPKWLRIPLVDSDRRNAYPGYRMSEKRLLHPPVVLGLYNTDLWTHGSGLASLDQMGISPTSTTTTVTLLQ
ncbi:hypothetical protein TNCV_640411 [Trichonephila clavipes]|nr:hypothetical protein TNCV_640411 [Trichonephila clavipes]